MKLDPDAVPLSVVDALGEGTLLLLGSDRLLGRCILEKLVSQTRVQRVLCVAASAAPPEAAQARLIEDLRTVGLERAWVAASATADGERRVEALPGGYLLPSFGLEDAAFRALARAVQVIINCAVADDNGATFVDMMRVHVGCVRDISRLVELAESPPAVCHVSTCYAAAAERGYVEESVALADYPRRRELEVKFSALAEIADLETRLTELEARSHSQAVVGELGAQLRAQGRPRTASRLQVEQERWFHRQASLEGSARAQHWGWPGSYPFTRALGERLLLLSDTGTRHSIVRHALLGPALSEPEPGWLGGPDVLSPLVFLAEKGLRMFPLESEQLVDIVPVDQVASACIAVAAMTRAGAASGVYHAAFGDRNPLRVGRLAELTDLEMRGLRPSSARSGTWLGKLRTLGGARAVGLASPAASLPGRLRDALELSARTLESVRTSEIGALGQWLGAAIPPSAEGALARCGAALEGFKERVQSFCEQEAQLQKMVASVLAGYAPFVTRERVTFSSRRTRALLSSLGPADRVAFQFSAESIDWQRYWLEVAIPGLRRHSFVRLGATSSALTATDVGLSPLGLVSRIARRSPKTIAIEAPSASGVRSLTYESLRAAAHDLCGRLRLAGANESADVVLLGSDVCDWLIALLAAFELDVESEASESPRAEPSRPAVLLICDRRELRPPSQWGTPVWVDELGARSAGAAGRRRGVKRPTPPLQRCSAISLRDALQSAMRLAESARFRERDRVAFVGGPNDDASWFASVLHVFAFGASAVFTAAEPAAAIRQPGTRGLVLSDDGLVQLWRELEPFVHDTTNGNRQAASALLSFSSWCGQEVGWQVGRALFATACQRLCGLSTVTCISGEGRRDAYAAHGLTGLGVQIIWLGSQPIAAEREPVPLEGSARGRSVSQAPEPTAPTGRPKVKRARHPRKPSTTAGLRQ